MSKTLLTAESVCAGHPDKLCDYIADSILDACLGADKESRCACEVMATGHQIIVAGEVTCNKRLDVRNIVRRCLRFVGYNPKDFKVSVMLHPQSKDICEGVDNSIESRTEDIIHKYDEQGAGDQGTMYGYACRETEEFMPLPLALSHLICRKLDEMRKSGEILGIKPDGKAQVTISYDGYGNPQEIDTIVISIQHDADKDLDVLKREIIDKILVPYVYYYLKSSATTRVLINPSGRFVLGGPAADTGLTGRKLMVDSYGGLALQGGGALSGKDASKVDRSGAYIARYIAKNIVAANLANKVLVGISYAIGKAHPVAVMINTFGTGYYDDATLADAVNKIFDMRPAAIIEQFHMKEIKYYKYSSYGHFGRKEAPWEKIDKVHDLRKAVNLDA